MLSLCCFLIVLVGLNSFFLPGNSPARLYFQREAYRSTGLSEPAQMEGGSSVAQALRVKPTGGLKLKKRLAELEKQVAVFTRLLKYEKDQRASDQSKNKDVWITILSVIWLFVIAGGSVSYVQLKQVLNASSDVIK